METSANSSGDSSDQGQAHCVPCSEGLHCPLGSNLTSLKTGESIVGEEFVPKLLKGYFSTEEKPIEVFKCQSSEHCLGGMPGQCAGEREVTSIPCAECPRGTSWSGDECVVCSGGVGVMWCLWPMPRKFSNSLFSDGRMDCEIDFLIHRRLLS